MMQEDDYDCFRLWRLRVTALYMLADRGYDIRPEDLSQSLTQFKTIYGDKSLREDLSTVVMHSDDVTDQLLLYFSDELQITLPAVERLHRRMAEQAVNKAIVIVREGITTQAKDVIDENTARYAVELVPESDLIGGVSEGDASDEKQELMNRYRYDDFHTIDWLRDLARDRKRHKFISSQKKSSILCLIASIFDAGSGWICVLMVGIAAGATAGIIDISARWMSDLKNGICADRFWLDREHCCWSANDTVYKDADCSSWTTWPEMLGYYHQSGFYYIIDFLCYVLCAVAMSGFAVSLVRVFAPYACGSGIPEIKCVLSGFVIRGYLGKWTFVIKAVGLILASASGLSLGKEGPMVHLACCIGNIFSYIFPKYGNNEAKKREILSASAAAGVSVAFGAPIGGVMFSLEEASYYFPLKTMWRSFFCALVAGIVLRFVNPFGSDQTSLFHVDYSMKWTFIELVPFACLGIFGGVIGAFFIWCNIRWCRYRKNSKILGQNPVYEVLVVTGFTAAIAYFNPYTRRSASSLIKQLFDRCGPEDYMMDLCDYQNKTVSSDKVDDNYHTGEFGSGVSTAFYQLIVAFACKFVFTVFTFGIKVPSGMFVPSMAMGAIAGRLLGIRVEGIFGLMQKNGHTGYWACQIGKDCVMPGLYAMVGAAAVLGGITRMTVSLVVIMFELTGSLEFIVPTMVAVMFAKWVGDAIGVSGIYDAHIELNQYPFLDNKGEYPYSTVALQVMQPSGGNTLHVIEQDQMTVGEVEQLLNETTCNGFPVVVSAVDMFITGYCTRRDLQVAISTGRKTSPNVTTNSKVYFSSNVPEFDIGGSGPSPLRLKKILDLAPMTLTDQTPMEIVIDMFRKLGLRQILITRNGRLLGIITKKDILRFMKDGDSI
uniref:Chloride channel protein n=1 Tax=Panagrellus redivivus TaxID=6233 RepID=A0A7E4VSU9_PANRE